MTTTRKSSIQLSDKCPAILRDLVEREGNFKAASVKLGVSVFKLRDIAKGKQSMPAFIAEKIDKLAGTDTSEAPPPKTYPEWDGKREAFPKHGKIPVPFVKLLKSAGGNKTHAAQAIGYKGWSSGIDSVLKSDLKYRTKMHTKVMAALAGDPLPTKNGNGAYADEADDFKMGLAIVTTSLTNYPRVEDIANILSGQRIHPSNTKSGLLVIFKFSTNQKTRDFKRLAARDADIACP